MSRGVLHHQLGQDWVDLIVELRTEYKMTALRIARQLDLARSTVAGVLQREGISQLKQLQLWLKGDRGHRVTGNRKQDSQGAGWEYVHIKMQSQIRCEPE